MKLSLDQFGELIGLSSKGQVSQIERDNRCSVPVALEIERLSAGRLPADTLNPHVAAVRSFDRDPSLLDGSEAGALPGEARQRTSGGLNA